MKTSIDFFRHLLHMPPPWLGWLMLLMAANLLAPLFFLHTLEARLTLGCIMAGALIQILLFARLGFVRLLGLGHTLWLGLVPFLALRVTCPPAGAFDYWLASVVGIDGLSLLIDIADVVRYLKGERAPTLTLA